MHSHCDAGLKQCLAAKVAAPKGLQSALYEDTAGADEDGDLDMLIINVSGAAEPTESFEWVNVVLGDLCADQDAKESILMALLMPVVRLCSLYTAHLWDGLLSGLGAMHFHRRKARGCWAHRLITLVLPGSGASASQIPKRNAPL